MNRYVACDTVQDKSDHDQFKAQHADETAVTDDIAGKAYVEQFGLETFERADNAVRANKASRQTADTFQAAATFLDLLAIWGAIDPEITSKIKYGKYHALRIAKALKAGENPNASNPAPVESEQLPSLDPNDAEVQALEGGVRLRQPSVVEVTDEADRRQNRLARTSTIDESLHPSRDPSPSPKPRQPSVAEVPDEASRLQAELARTSTRDESLHPSRAPSVPPIQEGVSPIEQDPASFYIDTDKGPVSPLDPPTERKPSIGGNYFPEVPAAMTQSPTSSIQPDSNFPPTFTKTGPPPPAPAHHHGRSIDEGPPPSISREHHGPVPPPPSQSQHFSPTVPNPSQFPQTSNNFPPPPPQIPRYQAPPRAPAAYPPPPAAYPAPPPKHVDEEAVISAQKHCRWAISAMNFEDIPTAIKELRGALQDLGGL